MTSAARWPLAPPLQAFLILLSASAGCCPADVLSMSQERMGTILSVKVWYGRGPCSKRAELERAVEDALDEAGKIEALMSEYSEDSAVFRINKLAGRQPVKVDGETWEVIRFARRIGVETGGAFDITFAPLGKLWDYRAKSPAIPPSEKIEAVLALVGIENLVLDDKEKTVFLKREGASIGLGGLAKGYALDRMAGVLESRGFSDFILDGGGDLHVSGRRGKERWKVGVRHPRKRGKLLAYFEVGGRWGVATSGDYERFFILDGVRYHHILDTRTGMPSRRAVSVTVVARSAMEADALATAIMVMGPEEAKKFHRKAGDFSALIIDAGMRLHRIGSFPRLVMAEGPSSP